MGLIREACVYRVLQSYPLRIPPGMCEWDVGGLGLEKAVNAGVGADHSAGSCGGRLPRPDRADWRMRE